ncbi:hypothetical protein RBH20_19910 [Haloarcula sp. H-GB4]|nr:hypothetical protein [Haloarcula sp. H-GB4]MDQ2074796.1 hypothetical protein [Haloarcula sp. H-GB4]
MVHNSSCPDDIEVDPEKFEVRVDGNHLTCERSSGLSLAQRYLL